jgi:hypothetical protein
VFLQRPGASPEQEGAKKMRPANSLHNPFINRFNDPVTRRRDEMQCDEYVAWLRERNLRGVIPEDTLPSVATHAMHLGRIFVGLCGLLVLVISLAAFIRAF